MRAELNFLIGNFFYEHKKSSPIEWVKIGAEFKLLGWGFEIRIKLRRLN